MKKYYLLFLFCNINTFSKCCDCGGKQYKIILCEFNKNWAIVDLCFFQCDGNTKCLGIWSCSLPNDPNQEYIECEYATLIKNVLYTKTHEYDLSLNNRLCFRKKAKLQVNVYNQNHTNDIKNKLLNADAVIFICSNAQTLDETKNFLNASGITDANIPVLVEFLHFNVGVEFKENTTYLDPIHFNVYSIDCLQVTNHKNNKIVFNNPKSRFMSTDWDMNYRMGTMRNFINSL